MIYNKSNINSINDWADLWYYQIGVNVIPADTKNKRTYENWLQWQDNPIPDELHEERKKNGEYNKGIALLSGKIWRGQFEGKYLIAIDLDNKKAKYEIVNIVDEDSIYSPQHEIQNDEEYGTRRGQLYIKSEATWEEMYEACNSSRNV